MVDNIERVVVKGNALTQIMSHHLRGTSNEINVDPVGVMLLTTTQVGHAARCIHGVPLIDWLSRSLALRERNEVQATLTER